MTTNNQHKAKSDTTLGRQCIWSQVRFYVRKSMRLQLCFTVGPIFVCVEVLSTRAEPKVEPNVIQQYPERGPNLSRTRTPPSKVLERWPPRIPEARTVLDLPPHAQEPDDGPGLVPEWLQHHGSRERFLFVQIPLTIWGRGEGVETRVLT